MPSQIQDKQISYKWLMLAFTIALLIAVAVSIISYENARKLLFKQIAEVNQQTVNQWRDRLDSELERIEGLSSQINYDPEIRNRIKTMSRKADHDTGVSSRSMIIGKKLDTYASANRSIDRIVLLSSDFMDDDRQNDGMMLIRSQSSNLNPTFDPINLAVFRQAFGVDKGIIWTPVWNNGILRRQDLDNQSILNFRGPTFSMLRKQANTASADGEQFIQIIEINASLMRNLFAKPVQESLAAFYLTAPDGTIVYSLDEQSYGKPLPYPKPDESSGLPVIPYQNDEMLLLTADSAMTGWKLHLLVPTVHLNAVAQQNIGYGMLNALLFLLLFVLTFLIIRKFHAKQQRMDNYAFELEQQSVTLEETNVQLQLASEQLLLKNESLQKQSDELVKLNAVKDQILANTSHELRTPLNGIIGIAESLQDGTHGRMNEDVQDQLRLIIASGKRLNNLVNDILDYSKLNNHKMDLIIRPTPLQPMLQQCLELIRPMYKHKKVNIELTVSDVIDRIEADEFRLQQVIYNLLSNACKFTEEGTIRIQARSEGASVRIDISDTGIGIPYEKQNDLFRAFEQVDGSIARKYGGTGLGLAITKQLVELHHGSITFQSAPGHGTTFTVRLPVQSPVEIIEAEETSETAAAVRFTDYEEVIQSIAPSDPVKGNSGTVADGGQPENTYRILIVDDEPINLKVILNHLKGLNYQCTTARDGNDALTIIASGEPFDLVLLDVMMPELSGYDVTRRIRTMYKLSELPVLLLTAKTQPEDLIAAFECGANDYMPKPIQKPELLARMQTHLRLANWNRSLNRIVEERTQSIRALLDYSEQGFLTIDQTLRVQPEYSKECAGLFGGEIAGKLLATLIASETTDDTDTIAAVLGKILENTTAANVPVLLGLLPAHCLINQKDLQIQYKPLPPIAGGQHQLMVIVSDVTEAKRLARQMEKEHQRLSLIVKAVSHEREINDLLRSFHEYALHDWPVQVDAEETDVHAIKAMRTIHTYRGHFLQYGFVKAAQRLMEIEHMLETQIRQPDTIPAGGWYQWAISCKLDEADRSERATLQKLLGIDPLAHEPVVRVKESALRALEQLLTVPSAPFSEQSWLRSVRGLYYLSIPDWIAPYATYVTDLAERREKKVPDVIFDCEPILIDPEHYANVGRSLVHLFRNIVEHALPSDDDWYADGNGLVPQITVGCRMLPAAQWELTVSDNGKGIDYPKLRRSIQNSGIDISVTIETMNEDQLAQYIFSDQISTSAQVNEYAGRGAGLPAVKEAVSNVGGSIRVTSILGEGTAFLVHFPVHGLIINTQEPVNI